MNRIAEKCERVGDRHWWQWLAESYGGWDWGRQGKDEWRTPEQEVAYCKWLQAHLMSNNGETTSIFQRVDISSEGVRYRSFTEEDWKRAAELAAKEIWNG